MEILIPSLLRVKPNALDKIGKYVRAGDWKSVAVFWGEGMKTMLGERVRVSFAATDVIANLELTIGDNRVESLFKYSLDIPPGVQALVAIGGGKILDCGKYLAHLLQKPLLAIPTAISNDGFCSPFSSLLVKDKRRTVKTILPEALVLDTQILACSPLAMRYSGMGDLFCKYTAIFDWKLAFKKRGDPVNDFAAVMARNAADTFLHFQPKDPDNLEFLRILSSSLMMTGIAMEIAASSRPASGSEHLISHAYDQIASTPSLHGLQVGVASYVVSQLQNDIAPLITRCAQECGFFDFVARQPLSKKEFMEAVKMAPQVKDDFYTVLSEPGACERALQFCESDPIMNRLLA